MNKQQRNIRIYHATYDYLKEITPKEIALEDYFKVDRSYSKSLTEVFRGFIVSAQNYQQMPNVIKFFEREPQIADILEGYDIYKVSEMNEKDLYWQFRNTFGVTSPDSKRNSWYKWSCSIIDAAKFLNGFTDTDDFDRFVKRFDYNAESRIALALLIQSKIRGMGFALTCDALKELGYVDYPKPDIHLIEVFQAVNLSEANQISTFEAIVRMADDCKEIDESITPYKVDKIFWLVCSGFYYKEQIKIKSHKQELIQHLKTVVGE